MPNDAQPATNVPHVDLAAALDPAALAIWLDYQYAEHAANNRALMERHQKFLDVTKDGISDDVIAGAAADFAKVLKAEAGATDETRTRIKAPVLHAQRLIDGEAKKLTDRLTAAAATVQTRLTVFLRDRKSVV